MIFVESAKMLRPLLTVALVLFGFSSAILAGRLSQRYLPTPQASQLHYHGVSGQGQARPGAGHSFGGGSSYQRQQQPQIPIVRSDYNSDANGNYNFG